LLQMIASIRSRISGLKKDRAHGAGWLASEAMVIFEEASSLSRALTTESFTKEIGEVAAKLMEARPGMVSIPNFVTEFQNEFGESIATSKSADNLKKRAAAIARKLKAYNEESSTKTARNAAKLIGQKYIVMTCSYSSDVCAALELARQKGIDFKVLTAESRQGKISYGAMTLERLNKAGIVGRIIPDNFIAWHAARANIVLIGADSVSMQGWMINGAPSYTLTLVASRKNVPVYTICATTKIDVRGFLAGLRVPEPGFDMLPLDLVKGIVTESGTLQAGDVYKMTIDDIFRSPRARPH
jgi:translation initiation factor 2B subunit (eIF-2B alpha/beta/delta family)